MLDISGISVLGKIYESSRSIVYRGIRERDNLPVILKLLRSQRPTAAEIARYKQEYEIYRALNGKGAIVAYSVETYQKRPLLILEDFGGESLKFFIKKQQLTLEEFLAIAIQIAEALGWIHAANIIHKDINPANIVFNSETSELKLIDFNIASILSRETPSLKTHKVVEGTLSYISPEQTGRMNRVVDYRTDFYSLGVTFYELLTGTLPFSSRDPMEVVHCHIAKQPIPPHQVDPSIPQAVSDIVMKLLSKTAEERYQSAWGIQADAIVCLMQLEATGEIEDLIPGENDISPKFQVSQKLYGRESEINALLSAFDRTVQTRSQMMLVTGDEGMGKTTLVRELSKSIAQKHGYFISGKFERDRSDIPYMAIIEAVEELLAQVLSESDSQLDRWRETLQEALTTNGQVLLEAIPELEHLVGPQTQVSSLPPIEAQNRFNLVFQNFIKVFASPSHPLVIFLDDLQWADRAELKLIQLLMNQPEPGLFLIGTYREPEIETFDPLSESPLSLTSAEIEKAGGIVDRIALGPLTLVNVTQLLADSLKCSAQRALPLAEIVWEKTQGNPFFIHEFLTTIYTDRLIEFEEKTLTWEWSLDLISERSITDNVVELLAAKIQKLNPCTQEILKLAACIGDRFDLQTLAVLSQQSHAETICNLNAAVVEGLVVAESDTYSTLSNSVRQADFGAIGECKFVHDRIQKAAYSLISEPEKTPIHLQIALHWLASWASEQIQDNIFELVNQINKGINAIDKASQGEELARFNLIAGKKTKASAAYSQAFKYFSLGIALLPDCSWETAYPLTLELYTEAAESTYLCGDLETTLAYVKTVQQRSKTVLDAIKAYTLNIQTCMAQTQPLAALKIGLDVARQLGITFPESPTSAQITSELETTRSHIGDRDPSALIDLPEMTAPDKRATMQILSSLISPAYQAAPQLFAPIVFKQVNLSLEFGNSPWSAFAYASYGVLLCGKFLDIEQGYKFGQLALNLLSKFTDCRIEGKILTVVQGLINPWKIHLKETLPGLRKAERSGIENGDLEWAAYAAKNYYQSLYYIGRELTGLEREIATHAEAIAKLEQTTVVQWNEIYRQTVLNLLGRSVNPCQLVGEAYNEVISLPLSIEADDRNGIHYLFLNKLSLCYLFEKFAEALENSQVAEQYLDEVTAMPVVALFYFYDSLTRLALCADTEASHSQILLERVTKNQEKMQRWVHHAPMNYAHKFYLIEAERHRIIGDRMKAMDLYDRAIELARESEYLQEEALANELAAKFYLNLGKMTIAKAYMQEAKTCYFKWGAMAKVRHLQGMYPQLFSDRDPSIEVEKHTGGTSGVAVPNGNSDALDLITVLKASQAIASEIVLDKLLDTLMKTSIENAGAQKGLLLLATDGKLLKIAAASVDSDAVAVEQSIPVETCDDLPVTLVKYVERTRSDVVLSHAARNGQFTHDPYIVDRDVKSVLCMPIVNGGKAIGILYLENNLIVGAFTNDRLEILRLLSSQAAISLENALLYASLEEKVQERTGELNQANEELNEKNHVLSQTLEELKNTQIQLIQTEKMSGLGQMVAGIAHEINNPVSFIYGNISHAQEYLEELFDLVHLYQKYCSSPPDEIQEAIQAIDLDFLLQDLPRLLSSMKTGADRIRKIVLGLRNFSRLDESDIKPVDIHEGIESTLLILHSRLTHSDGSDRISVTKQYGNLPRVACYASQLNQVVMNILNNAIDALESMVPSHSSFFPSQSSSISSHSSAIARKRGEQKGERTEVQITHHSEQRTNDLRQPIVTIHTEAISTQWVKIRIADNGPGMTESVRQKIFDPFFTTKPVGKGTGLGLSIAYSIVVEKHGGRLTCASTLGKGTEFTIEIPIQARSSQESDPEIPPPVHSGS